MPFRWTFRFVVPMAAVACLFLSGEAYAKCRMKGPDISIAGIALTDRESAVKVVGESAKLEDSEDDLPHARFVSTNGAQELVLFAHYGAIEDEYAEAEVRIAGPEALALKDLPIESFKTGRGVELGMSVAQVQALFGTCFKSRQKTGQELFFEYEIENADRDPELKTFGFPVYYAEYEFKRGKLVRFRFGFAYP
ncbi:hypothetical protein [Hyphomicrobium sp.]|uniref:hypothetical protein n=1 Tax=Hyphomicrobium sp. TaxID=82 RepID=UPI0025C40A87|nr:hypothetical protein [Hyphomicrobium sp.]MCC7251511.1 hypothetical protein [Hyphomicrobium sp.]